MVKHRRQLLFVSVATYVIWQHHDDRISTYVTIFKTRKHSSRMHTTRFSSSGGGGLLNPRRQTLPGCRPLCPRCRLPVGRPPPPCEQADRCKNITLPQTSFARGYDKLDVYQLNRLCLPSLCRIVFHLLCTEH